MGLCSIIIIASLLIIECLRPFGFGNISISFSLDMGHNKIGVIKAPNKTRGQKTRKKGNFWKCNYLYQN